MGSSPPVRGALIRLVEQGAQQGLIPARAGSTHPLQGVGHLSRAHPRPCGEHVLVGVVWGALAGSSPPVRGALVYHHEEELASGLIPARAGSTCPSVTVFRVVRAHPRPCGEHVGKKIPKDSSQGSSPPVRGALMPPQNSILALGLIPARAGSTEELRNEGLSGWAHPRPCGEHFLAFAQLVGRVGSSPPVRGALFLYLGHSG